MYVELITRITTQSLDDTDGDEETALNSIYQLFPITREILKSKGRNAENFSKIAIIVLNQIIRPFTAKWHKKKLNGAFSNQDECILFRTELKQLQWLHPELKVQPPEANPHPFKSTDLNLDMNPGKVPDVTK